MSVQEHVSISDVYVQAVVNSEVEVKMEKLSVTLNKEAYELAKASVSKLNAQASMRDENLNVKGMLVVQVDLIHLFLLH